MLKEIAENINDVITSCDTVQFCTFSLGKYPETRTISNELNMTIGEDFILYFLTNLKSHKLAQVLKNNNVCLYYFNQISRRAMRLFGEVEIIDSMNEKVKFWDEKWVDYGYEGKYDPDYCIIKFLPSIYKYYIGKDEIYGSF